MANASMSFLDLSYEVRLQIYKLALIPSRLCVRPILDPEWLLAPDRGCRVAPLLFVSKQIYQEVAPIFYSMATLEVTPCQHDPSDARNLCEFFQQYQDDHAFCPPNYSTLIRNVHLYGDKSWPMDQDSFQALFRWLVLTTGVENIYLSRKTMQQSKHIPEFVCLNNLPYDVAKQDDETRIVDICARNVSSRLRIMDGSNYLHTRTKPWPDVQLYLNLYGGTAPKLYREPRWDLLTIYPGSGLARVDKLKQEMDRFAGRNISDTFLKQAHADGYLWLYKTIQIQRRTGNSMESSRSNPET